MWLLPVLAGLSRVAARCFYRLQVAGPEVPKDGPVLLLANHPNSLLDPALVAAAAGRSVRFLAKSTLFNDARVGWLVRASGAIPVYRRSDDPQAAERNATMFAAVYRELAAGSAVGIFPEGISHSGSSLAKLRTGSARIALGTHETTGVFPLIPLGLVLGDKGVFRSEVLVIRGEPVVWDDLAGNGEEDQEAVRELTARLDRALREVTVNLEHWEDRPLVDCAQAIWSTEIATETDEVEQVKRAQTAARVLADLRRGEKGGWRDLARDVNMHRRRLAALGLLPGDLDAEVDLGTGFGWTAKRLPLLGPPAVLLGLAGAGLFWLPYRVTDRIVRAMGPEEDQSSTYKLLVGAVVYLIWVLLLSALAGWLQGPWTALLVFLLSPFLGLAGQWVRERWQGAVRDVRRFFLLRSRREIRQGLKQEQIGLAHRLHAAFEQWRDEVPKDT